jgi:hypothetical protein
MRAEEAMFARPVLALGLLAPVCTAANADPFLDPPQLPKGIAMF